MLITGITGQDGSYLAEFLLEKGYEVHGMVRRVALEDPEHRLSRLLPVLGRLHLHAASLESYASIHTLVEKVQPEECYHLAAQSFVSYSLRRRVFDPERQHQRDALSAGGVEEPGAAVPVLFRGVERDVRPRRRGAAE